jgi:hypothetical protein
MAIVKKEFGYHSKDNGDEWWFYLARDTQKPLSEVFVICETDFRGVKSETTYKIGEYLTEGHRGTGKLLELIASLVKE